MCNGVELGDNGMRKVNADDIRVHGTERTVSDNVVPHRMYYEGSLWQQAQVHN